MRFGTSAAMLHSAAYSPVLGRSLVRSPHMRNFKLSKGPTRRSLPILARAGVQGKVEAPAISAGKLSSVLLTLALSGGTTGTFLDGIHSRAQVLIYDSAPIQMGGLMTSLWVPPLLAAFYFVLGGTVIFADSRLAPVDKTTRRAMQHASLSKMALSFGALAAMLELSSYLYSHDYESNTICLILAACAALNYLVFDSTKQGLSLAVMVAVAAPATELLLMGGGHLWHYPAADLYPNIAGGMLKWVPFCYFFYVPAVSNLARFIWKAL